MNIAFVCCTPYQLFNAINYIINNPEDYYDAFICDHFNSSSNIYNNLKQCGLLNNCYYFTTNVKRNVFKRIIYALNTDVKKISNCDNLHDYDEVIVGSFNNITTVLFYKYCKKNNKKISIIDEGIGSYYFKNLKNTWKHRYIRLLLGHVISKKYLHRILLYNPALFTGETDVLLEPLPKLARDNLHLKSVLNDVFSYSCKMKTSCKVIYFDQPLNQYLYKGNEVTQSEYTQFILGEIRSVVSANDFIVKWHPRTPLKIQQTIINHDEENSSLGGWEMELINGANKNIYISVCSTAALLGNMLFNDDDVIIFLYKIECFDPKDYIAVDAFIKKMQQTKINVLLPTSWNEFYIMLKESYFSINSLSSMLKDNSGE